MTPEQQRLVVENVDIAHLERRRLFRNADDEYDGAAYEALCKAAIRWRPGTGTFRGYARTVVRGSLIDFHRAWRRENGRAERKTKFMVVSADAPPPDHDDPGEPGALLDSEGFAEADIADQAIDVVDLANALAKIGPRKRSRLLRYAAGKTMSEVGAEDGVTGSAVSRWFESLAERYRRTA